MQGQYDLMSCEEFEALMNRVDRGVCGEEVTIRLESCSPYSLRVQRLGEEGAGLASRVRIHLYEDECYVGGPYLSAREARMLARALLNIADEIDGPIQAKLSDETTTTPCFGREMTLACDASPEDFIAVRRLGPKHSLEWGRALIAICDDYTPYSLVVSKREVLTLTAAILNISDEVDKPQRSRRT